MQGDLLHGTFCGACSCCTDSSMKMQGDLLLWCVPDFSDWSSGKSGMHQKSVKSRHNLREPSLNSEI